jgi:hypothetical protein
MLDGQYQGETPLDLDRVCSGPHHLEVKHSTTGKYVEDIVVEKNEVLTLECPIRPSLAFLGLVADEGVAERDLEDIRQKLTSELQTLEVMNLIVPSSPEELLGEGGIWGFVSDEIAPDRSDMDRDEVRELSEKVARELEVEAFLVGYVPEQRLTKDVVFNILAAGSTRPDIYSLNYLDQRALPTFIERLSESTRLYGSWIGLRTVDTRLAAGPIVLAVDQGGPAAPAGIEVGDVILEADGAPVEDSHGLSELVRAKEPGGTLMLALLDRTGQSREVSVEVGRTPLEIPLEQSDFLYNRAIIDLRHRLALEPQEEPLVRLNLALCHMELGDYETALREHLPRIVFEGGRGGISQGTVYYYQGMSYLKLGETGEAARMFEQAMSFEEATLESNDGPHVAPMAQRRLRSIGQ